MKEKLLDLVTKNKLTRDSLSPVAMETFAYILSQGYYIEGKNIISTLKMDDLCERYGVTKSSISNRLKALQRSGLVDLTRERRKPLKFIVGKIVDDDPILFLDDKLNILTDKPAISKNIVLKTQIELSKIYKKHTGKEFSWDNKTYNLVKDVLKQEDNKIENLKKYYKYFLDYGEYFSNFSVSNKTPQTFIIFYHSMFYLYDSTSKLVPTIKWIDKIELKMNEKGFFNEGIDRLELSKMLYNISNKLEKTKLNMLENIFAWFLDNYEETRYKYHIPTLELFFREFNNIQAIYNKIHDSEKINTNLTKLFN